MQSLLPVTKMVSAGLLAKYLATRNDKEWLVGSSFGFINEKDKRREQKWEETETALHCAASHFIVAAPRGRQATKKNGCSVWNCEECFVREANPICVCRQKKPEYFFVCDCRREENDWTGIKQPDCTPECVGPRENNNLLHFAQKPADLSKTRLHVFVCPQIRMTQTSWKIPNHTNVWQRISENLTGHTSRSSTLPRGRGCCPHSGKKGRRGGVGRREELVKWSRLVQQRPGFPYMYVYISYDRGRDRLLRCQDLFAWIKSFQQIIQKEGFCGDKIESGRHSGWDFWRFRSGPCPSPVV